MPKYPEGEFVPPKTSAASHSFIPQPYSEDSEAENYWLLTPENKGPSIPEVNSEPGHGPAAVVMAGVVATKKAGAVEKPHDNLRVIVPEGYSLTELLLDAKEEPSSGNVLPLAEKDEAKSVEVLKLNLDSNESPKAFWQNSGSKRKRASDPILDEGDSDFWVTTSPSKDNSVFPVSGAAYTPERYSNPFDRPPEQPQVIVFQSHP